MPDIHILRAHALGLEGARALAARWVADAQQDYGMQCVLEPGEVQDRVSFKQPGVQGSLLVSAEQFELTATLGFLFKGFRQKITDKVESRLDELLMTQGDGPHQSA